MANFEANWSILGELRDSFKHEAARHPRLGHFIVEPLDDDTVLPACWQTKIDEGPSFQKSRMSAPSDPIGEFGYLYGTEEQIRTFQVLAQRAWLAVPGTGKDLSFPQAEACDRWLALVYFRLVNQPGTFLADDDSLWVRYRAPGGEETEQRFLPQQISRETPQGTMVEIGYPEVEQLPGPHVRWKLSSLASDPFFASLVVFDWLLTTKPYFASLVEVDAYQKTPEFQNADFLIDAIILGNGRKFPIYRHSCKLAIGTVPTLCPKADYPTDKAERQALRGYLPDIAKAFRTRGIINENQTIHWVGRQASLASICRCEQTQTGEIVVEEDDLVDPDFDPSQPTEIRIRKMMHRLSLANDKFREATLRLVFVQPSESFADTLGRVRTPPPIPQSDGDATQEKAPTSPDDEVRFPMAAIQGCDGDECWGAFGIPIDDRMILRCVALFWGGPGSTEAAREFRRLAVESGRLYQTSLSTDVAPSGGTNSTRNLWANVLFGRLFGTPFVEISDDFERINLPFAASVELWRLLLQDGDLKAGKDASNRQRKPARQPKTVKTPVEPDKPGQPRSAAFGEFALTFSTSGFLILKKQKGVLRRYRVLDVSKGNQTDFLKALVESDGYLTRDAVTELGLKGLRLKGIEVVDTTTRNNAFRRMAPHISRIRQKLKTAIGTDDIPLLFDDSEGYRLLLPIVFDVSDDAAEPAYKQRHEMTSEERMDL
jgi:hypothetical protein